MPSVKCWRSLGANESPAVERTLNLMETKMSDKSSSSSGIGFFGMLGVVFIGLKLTGHIDWSWWWVTAPLWGPLTLVLAIILVVILIHVAKN